MIEGMLGRKIGMSRMFTGEGNSVSVSLISCGPCYITAKMEDRVQIGYEEIKEKALNKPRLGYLGKKNLPPLKYLREVKISSGDKNVPEEGEKVNVGIFKPGDKVDVSGVSKGKGFAGVIKRWNFRGGPGGHGSHLHRGPGSIGGASDPSRVFPGQKMAGRMGGEKITQMNLKVIEVDKDRNIIAVGGSVPGPKKGLVYLRKTRRGTNAN